MIIQIYAFTGIDEVHQALAAGVDHIGFIAGKYGIVQAELDFKQAAALAREVTKPARSVALTMSTEIDEIVRMTETIQPDIVHISSETDALCPDSMATLREKLHPSVKIIKAIGISDHSSVTAAMEFSRSADILLLDTKIEHLPGVGATGKTHDWGISSEIVEKCMLPVILAGGLNVKNVAAAIRKVKPWGVDSNTSTNRLDSLFAKDIQRIREFVKAVRSISDGDPVESR
ncbi:MAG: phosphoribosylanthranilate isomerase [Anaerolineaceae bacterium]|nr:phosphoribosylanthranilate isomerase [Anaerolineaceae bacterium]